MHFSIFIAEKFLGVLQRQDETCILVEKWTSASTYPRVPIRIEIMADKELSNGSLYTLHHIYDFYNFKAEEPDSRTMFQVLIVL